jgi:hypothetical protein
MWLRRILATGALAALVLQPAHAEDVYLAPDRFVERAFDGDPPDQQAVWLSGATREAVESILNHSYQGARIRYWRDGERTAWILEEIGKHEPITTGLIVDGGAIQRVRVLIYREPRGWEVRREVFLEQFEGATLTDDRQLDRSIDGISGATLSVRALTKLARLALYLHQRVTDESA